MAVGTAQLSELNDLRYSLEIKLQYIGRVAANVRSKVQGRLWELRAF
jgi:hypothetical protein